MPNTPIGSVSLSIGTTKKSPSAAELGDRLIRVLRRHVENVDYLSRIDGTIDAPGRHAASEDRSFVAEVRKGLRRVMQCDTSVFISVPKQHRTKYCLANASRILQHGVEDG